MLAPHFENDAEMGTADPSASFPLALFSLDGEKDGVDEAQGWGYEEVHDGRAYEEHEDEADDA